LLITLNHKDKKTLKSILCFCVLVVFHTVAQAQTEAESLNAIKLATNPTTKLTAAEEFIARFPNSNARLSIAELVSAEILKVKDGAVTLALLERARAIFTSDQEWEVFKPVALKAYATGNRSDDAFALASEMLAKNPDDLSVLLRMTQVGTDEARKRNRKHTEVALQYGLKAIALIEAGSTNKADLAQLYQQTAILYLAAENTEEAKSRLTKATTLAPQDPSNFALLGRVINADYVSQKQDLEVLDTIIDAYARAVALAIGRLEYQPLVQQVMPDLTAYFKHRHGSIKGLQHLINKYRRK
jgi:tetratricopeptide (TPR) repeat protein